MMFKLEKGLNHKILFTRNTHPPLPCTASASLLPESQVHIKDVFAGHPSGTRNDEEELVKNSANSNLSFGFWLNEFILVHLGSSWPRSLSSLRRDLEVQAPKWCRQSGTDPLLRPLNDPQGCQLQVDTTKIEQICFTLFHNVSTRKDEEMGRSSKSRGTSPCYFLRLLQEVGAWCQHYPAPSVWSAEAQQIFPVGMIALLQCSAQDLQSMTKTWSGLWMDHHPNDLRETPKPSFPLLASEEHQSPHTTCLNWPTPYRLCMACYRKCSLDFFVGHMNKVRSN